jgi:4'-phosphopantetheinyl transferase
MDGLHDIAKKKARTSEPRSDVHLWIAAVSELEDPDRSAAAWAVLSTSEQHHAERFHFERDRNAFLATRSLRRHLLSHYAAVEPKRWRFTSNEHGRPRIAYPAIDETLEFNCSKTADLVVCAITRGIRVGVDIERLDRPVSAGVAESTLAPREMAVFRALPRHDRSKRFFTYWTLKEAYLKARGLGLSLPLHSVAFHVADSPRLEGHLASSAANDCNTWQFMLLCPTPSHITAVCVPRQSGLDPHLVMRRVSAVQIPLQVMSLTPLKQSTSSR